MATPILAFNFNDIVFQNELKKAKSGPIHNLYCSVRGMPGRAGRVRFQITKGLVDATGVALDGLPTTPYAQISDPIPGGAANKVSLALSLEDPELLAAFAALDARNKAAVLEGAASFFPKSKDLTEANITEMYTGGVVKRHPDDKYPPTASVKVRLPEDAEDDAPLTEIMVWLGSEEMADGTTRVRYRKGGRADLAGGNKFAVTCEASGLWFRQREFGMSLSAKQVLVFPSGSGAGAASGINAFSFVQAAVSADEEVPEAGASPVSKKRTRDEEGKPMDETSLS